MDLFWFKDILVQMRLWRRPQPQHRPVALKSSVLGTLPNEIILQIISFLPPESAASFSLCCLQIYSRLGRECLKSLEEEPSDRFKFLAILEREHSEYMLCYYCKKLHKICLPEQYLLYWTPDIFQTCAGKLLLCWKEENRHWGYLHPDFSFAVVQMAMKRYHQGRDYSDLLKGLSRNARSRQTGRDFWQHKSLARIIDGSFLYREQFILGTPRSELNERFDSIQICPHIRIGYGDTTAMIGCTPLEPQWIRQCKYCLTEFQIDFTEVEESGPVVVITKWMDLGSGCSPDDPLLRTKIGEGGRVWYDPGFICPAFQQQVQPKFESFVSQEDKNSMK
jgi:hypothetical protein